jgi:gliding motility-associated-like protein
METSTSLKAILSILVILFTTIVTAQNLSDAENKYRVTAYQKGNSHIFSLSNEVQIQPSIVYYIPSAFTPNGDGLNETFGIVGEGIVEYNIQIFNRWGNLIFESNDPKIQWDGNDHNEKAPTGTYVYKITGKGLVGDGITQKKINENGQVTLVL